MSPRQLAHPVFEPGDGFVGDAAPELRFVPYREAKERAVPRSGDGTLLRVDLKLEAPFDEAGQALHDPVAGLFAAHVDVTVIRVTHEPVATTLELAIQLIQHEIREQRRERTALRGPFPAVLEQPVVEHTSRQIAPDEPEQSPVANARRHRSHQAVVVHPVEGSHHTLPTSTTLRVQ
jgi:hypothetical protein